MGRSTCVSRPSSSRTACFARYVEHALVFLINYLTEAFFQRQQFQSWNWIPPASLSICWLIGTILRVSKYWVGQKVIAVFSNIRQTYVYIREQLKEKNISNRSYILWNILYKRKRCEIYKIDLYFIKYWVYKINIHFIQTTNGSYFHGIHRLHDKLKLRDQLKKKGKIFRIVSYQQRISKDGRISYGEHPV